MKMKQNFPLQRTAISLLVAAAFPMLPAHTMAAGSAGVAQFIAGDVNVLRADGKTEALAKGKPLESGESILTGNAGRAQVRFSDGGLISLQPNTEFKIANYVDKTDPKEDRFLVDLLRGSMRAITGLIGKRNRENYKVTTTTATIGIRGSGFSVGYNPDGSLGVTTELDAIEVCNAGGCVGLTAGESVRVTSSSEAPVRTNVRASVPTPAPTQDVVVAGNQTTSDGKPSIVPVQPPAPKVLVGLAVAGYGIRTGRGDQGQIADGSVVIDTTGNPERYVGGSEPTTIVRDGGAVTTVVSNTGSLATGDLLVLGTWSSATLTDSDGASTIAPVAFVTGVSTPAASIAALSGQRGEYALADATPVFSSTGATGQLLPSSKVSVDFLGIGNYADVNLDVRMAGTTDYNLRGGAKGTGSGFAGVLSVSSSDCIQGTANCGASSPPATGGLANFGTQPTGFVNGFFSGPQAAKLGLSYGAYGTPHGDFGGAATFASAAPPSPTPSNSSLTDLQVHLVDGVGYLSGYGMSTYDPYQIVTPSFTGEAMISVVQSPGSYYAGGTTYTYANTGTGGSFSAIGKVSDPDFIGWGNWVSSTKTTSDMYGSTSTMLDTVHYLVGRPTPSTQMPTTGTAQYSLIGGTAPTATLGGVTTTGTLISASLSADFGTSSANINIATKFGATPVNIDISPTSPQSYGAAYISGSTFSGCGPSGLNVNGIFSGNMAYRAGLVYRTTDAIVGNVSGAAVFQRTGSGGLAVGSPPL